jgi:hypothetical protein
MMTNPLQISNFRTVKSTRMKLFELQRLKMSIDGINLLIQLPKTGNLPVKTASLGTYI